MPHILYVSEHTVQTICQRQRQRRGDMGAHTRRHNARIPWLNMLRFCHFCAVLNILLLT